MQQPVRVKDESGPAPTVPARSGSGPGRPSWRRWVLRDELGVVIVLLLLITIVGIAHPPFLTRGNLLSTAQNSVYVGLMACGMVFPLAMREVDLSVGGNYALGIVVGADLMKHGLDPWLAAVLLVLLCTALGAVNGLITTAIQAPSFIVTLASALLFRGAALALANGKQIGGLPAENSLFTVVGGDLAGVPTSVWILLAAAVLLTVLFTRTRFGAQVRAVGSNPQAAVFSGLPIGSIRVRALAMSGLLAGIAAVAALAFFISGDPTVGQGYELTAIAACIIGGTPLIGGKGSVPGALMGSLILSVVASSLVFFNVPINWTTFATGAVILVAVGLDAQLRRTRGRGVLPGRRPRTMPQSAVTVDK